jgi:hypothetical protein
MDRLRDFPLVVFVISLVVLWFSAQLGIVVRKRLRPVDEGESEDLNTVETATLTLLALIVGFSFSMAISRYDQRKNYEAEEANAIGTEYLRAGLLPATDAEKTRALLKQWVRLRIAFYESRDERGLQQIDTNTDQLQNDLWSVVQDALEAHPTFPVTLAVTGMNDVLNNRGYTQAWWWNRIPTAAWYLMASLGILCNLIVGYSAHRTESRLFVVLPLALSISFLLISDVDSPRGGIIRILPVNLVSLSQSLHIPVDSE